jgi:hypothetical protein
MKHQYRIDGEKTEVELCPEDIYEFGNQEILAERYNDLSQGMHWFEEGYIILNSHAFYQPKEICSATTTALKK